MPLPTKTGAATPVATLPTTRAAICALTLLSLAALGIGCKEVIPPPPPAPKSLYTGPLHPLPQIVSVLSQRSAGVRTLWARHDFAVSFRDRKGKVHNLDGDGVMLLRKPDQPGGPGLTELRLTGSKDLVGQVFDLGVNPKIAWLTLKGDIDTQWWLPTNPVPANLDATEVPVRPDLVPELLGLKDWSTDLNRYPSPVLTYDADTDEYVLTLVEPAPAPTSVATGSPGGLIARRQLRLNRGTLIITSISFFTPDGRLVAKSLLAGWQTVAGLPADTRVPADVQLFLPGSNTNLRFTLRDIAPRKGNLPADISFAYPPKPPVDNVIRLGESEIK